MTANTAGGNLVEDVEKERGFLLPIVQNSPINITPKLVHMRSLSYDRRCKRYFLSTLDFPYQYYSTIAQYSFIHLTHTLYKVFLPVLQFSLSVSLNHCSILIHSSTTHAEYVSLPVLHFYPVNIIPPFLHTHSIHYNSRCIMFLPSTSGYPCQYHFTIAPYSFIHLPPILYNVFLTVLQVSPVSIIPSLLHTHSFIYHTRCIMLFSQYFSFPLSVSFHHCSILIHSSTTHTV